MITASGGIILARDTNRICLQLRGDTVNHGNTWGFWGGKSEEGELPVQTLLRELREEIGILPDIERVIPFSKFFSKDKNFEYNVFVVSVYEEFIPVLNTESNGYAWVNIDKYPRPLHNGARIVLTNKTMRTKLHTIIDNCITTNQPTNWVDTL